MHSFLCCHVGFWELIIFLGNVGIFREILKFEGKGQKYKLWEFWLACIPDFFFQSLHILDHQIHSWTICWCFIIVGCVVMLSLQLPSCWFKYQEWIIVPCVSFGANSTNYIFHIFTISWQEKVIGADKFVCKTKNQRNPEVK